jgi:hypothetical protein
MAQQFFSKFSNIRLHENPSSYSPVPKAPMEEKAGNKKKDRENKETKRKIEKGGKQNEDIIQAQNNTSKDFRATRTMLFDRQVL